MKRVLSFILFLCLSLGLAAPATAMTPPAEQDLEAALRAVTERVKQTLDIDDGYAEFSGDRNDGVVPGWYLRWADDTRELSVTCTEDAVVREFYRWRTEDRSIPFYGFDAAFPRLTEADARSQAEGWLGRLMAEGESARIDGADTQLSAEGAHRYTGRILKNGLETPITFELRIDENGPQRYSRSDGYQAYVGKPPAPLASAGESDAAALLAASVQTELYYVTDGSKQARLRYVPVGPYTVVDAGTGKAVDMDALYASFGASAKNGPEAPMAMETEAAADGGMGRGLTEVELLSISQYADAMGRDALDASLRAVPELGLTGFELARCSYTMDAEGDITANLRYTCEMTADRLFGFSRASFDDLMSWNDKPIVYKYLSLNAVTGELLSVSTSYPLWDGELLGQGEDASVPAAEAFLTACAPEQFAETGLCTLKAAKGRDGLTYARTHDGYFFPENYLYVRVNAAEQSVEEYSRVWDDNVTFAASRGIVSEAAAHRAYTDALELTLGYVAWPEEINYADPVLARYADWGYTFVESLRLAYYYGVTDAVSGVDALTSEAVRTDPGGGFAYTDLDGDARRGMIEALGSVGVGFSGGEFRPNETLTRREAVTLLLQAAGYRVDEWEDDRLHSEAVYLGLLPAGAWAPDEAATRMDFIRMVIGASRYGAAAELPGVWVESFSDVSPKDMGYAAIAKSLGMAASDPLLPDAECTRAAAAVMLYGFMTR